MNKIIDLRSDTVTLPSAKMRSAIAAAKLGDDVFNEDPSVNELETKSAAIMGKDASLLVPSGTMGNLVSILVHCQRGTEIIVGDKAHTFVYEAGGVSAFGGIHSRQLKNKIDGTIDIYDIKSAIRMDNIHFPKTSAITLENTHNLCNGAPLTPVYINSVSEITNDNNMKLHIDGARIFNAAVALNVDVKELVKDANSVTFCLSKGLAAPIGSVICGSEEFIYHARRIRKALGGGMRQAGIIAAAGIFSLDSMLDQIRNDHQNAKQLAEGIDEIEGLFVDKKNIKSNILYFDIERGKSRCDELDSQTQDIDIYPFEINLDGVRFFESRPDHFRLVTHYGVKKDDIKKALEVFKNMIF
jgi:threonine aldolase